MPLYEGGGDGGDQEEVQHQGLRLTRLLGEMGNMLWEKGVDG